MRFSLGALLGAGQKIAAARSNTPSVRDLQLIRDEFAQWRDYYNKRARESAEKARKYELIDEAYEARSAHDSERSAVADAATCEVGMRALDWAMREIRK